MTPKMIAIGSDHAGFELKRVLKNMLAEGGYAVSDLGTEGTESVDYPDFAQSVASEVSAGGADIGVLICGSGIGMSIAANRHPGIRAALCHDEETARLAREHNDANILVLGSRLVGEADAKACLRVFLETEFEGGRHARRVAKLA